MTYCENRLNCEMWTFLSKICVLFLLSSTYSLCSACDGDQYEIDGMCCTMCSPGFRVLEDCTANSNTTCVLCPEFTFTDKMHSRRICKPCQACKQGLGLKTAKECTASSDAVCGVLEGNYCIDSYEGGCRAAQKHTTCKPGQFIKHPGTEYNDTVCENCTENTHSDGSSTSCTPHTDCESKGLPTIRRGDSVSDSVCGGYRHHIILIFLVVLLSGCVGLLIYLERKNSNSSGSATELQDV